MGVRVTGTAYGGTETLLTGGTITGNLIVTGTLNGQGAVDFDSTMNVDGTTEIGGRLGLQPTLQTIAAATDTISPATGYVRLANSSGGALTLTSTPNITTAGVADGTILYIRGAAEFGVTLQDEAVLVGSGVRLNASANKTITTLDMIQLIFDAATTMWRQAATLQALA